MKKSLMRLFEGLSWLPVYWRMASTWHMSKIISLRSTTSCRGGWNIRMIWELARHHTRCVRTCRRRWNNQTSHLSSQNILSAPLPYSLYLLIILTTFSLQHQFHSSQHQHKCFQVHYSLIHILQFLVSWVTLSPFFKYSLNLAHLVWPCTGF